MSINIILPFNSQRTTAAGYGGAVPKKKKNFEKKNEKRMQASQSGASTFFYLHSPPVGLRSDEADLATTTGFSESATYDDVMAGDCTSCAVTQDKSAYWTPAMYFKHSDGTFELVPQTGGMLA